jgi:hypothetical protein
MSQLPRLLLRPALAVVALALVAAVPLFAATAAHTPAAAPGGAGAHARTAGGPPSATKTFHLRSHATCPTGHFLYADQGSYNALNGVDAYRINADCSLTSIGFVQTASIQSYVYFGANHMAASRANGPCVFHSDSGGSNGSQTFPGLVESFAVAGNGALTLVSSVQVADGSTYVAGDIDVAASGTKLFAANIATTGTNGSQLQVLTVGSGCKLSLASTLTVASSLYTAIEVVAPSALEAIDFNGHIDFYTISGTKLTLHTSNPSAITNPNGVDHLLAGKTLYSLAGQASVGPPQAELDTTTNGTLQPFPGSPATDGNPTAANGGYVTIDAAHKQGIESEPDSHTLGLFGLKAGKFAWLNDTSLTANDFDPSTSVILGSALYVNNLYDASFNSGPIMACTLAAGAITNCADVATRGSPGGVAGGVIIL